ncbi:MAG: hypothetical protein WDZ47_12790 [Bacteroidales bacterium]
MRGIQSALMVVLTLVLLSPNVQSQEKRALELTDIMQFRQIGSPAISDNGNWVAHASVPDRGDPDVLVYSTDGEISFTIPLGDKPVISSDEQWVAAVRSVPAEELEKPGNSRGNANGNLEWNNRMGSLAFLAGETEDEKRLHCVRSCARLYLWKPGVEAAALQRCDPPKGWLIHHTNKLQWSKDGERLFMGIKPESEIVQEKEKADSVADLFDREAILAGRTVDVWHWDDPYINPNQKKRWKKEKDRVYTGVFYPDRERFVPLADQKMPGIMVGESENYVVGYSNVPYAKRRTWDGRYNDYYLVDLVTGDRRLVLEEQQHGVSLSPDGKKMVYFREGNWHLVDAERFEAVTLTTGLGVPFVNEDWDYPADLPGYGVAGWFDQSEAVWIYDKYDIWAFDTSAGEAECVTEGEGRSRRNHSHGAMRSWLSGCRSMESRYRGS